jgi:hypothetical protein
MAETYPPRGYVQAYPVITHGDYLPEGVATAEISTTSHPTLGRALNLIREDSGGPSWPNQEGTIIAARWSPWLDRMEAAVAMLADNAPAPEDPDGVERVIGSGRVHLVDSELYSFCNGEEQVMNAIAARSQGLTAASHFLSDFFEGWTYFEDGDGFDPLKPPEA